MRMKRRSKSSTKFPLTTVIGDFARNRGFEKPCETREVKRVRFDDGDGAPVLASSGGCEAIQSSEYGAPKTSEYAYFKNMKCGAVRDRSRAQREENDEKNSKIDYLVRGSSSAFDKLKPRMEDVNFSVSAEERAEPSDHTLFYSPRVSKYNESDQIRSKELTNQIKKRSSLLSENVTPVGQSLFSSPHNKPLEETENQCNGKGIFSAKRQRLRLWAHSSFPEVEKLHDKGFDLVPLLLSRLFPKGNENNDASKSDAINSCKSLTVSKSNDLENRLDESRKIDWENDLPKACFDRWSDIVLAQRDNFIPGFPFNYHKENNFLDEFIDPDIRSRSHEHRSSHTRLGFPLCLPFESYKSSGYSHLNDPEECGSIIEHQREPYRLLMEWDNELGQDRLNSSTVSHGIEKNVCTRLDNSWNVDRRRIVDNVLDENMCSSSLLSSAYYLECNTVPSYSSKGCLMPDFGPEFNDVKCEMEECPLALSYAPKCITLGEDKNCENVLSTSNIISSYRDEDWLNETVWEEKPLSKFWWKCVSASDDYPSVFPENENELCSVSRLKEACVEESFTPLYEGVFNSYFMSPLPQSSLNACTNCPLLLDHVSEDRELYFDELGYIKIL